ncbi:MAG: 5'-nucleotidase C-terminal domain-containing protein [Alphaproteobacteria bacterium]|nr:5'-nucleotidase C-terminal domain-containing protein [Alphaproteobacteria bacterium]
MSEDTSTDIKIFALTDCHQEARRLACLFNGIIKRSAPTGKGSLICDAGDLFKGIYDPTLCIHAYQQLKKQLPQAEIVVALGNNDFGFTAKQFNFLQDTSLLFHEAGIHLLCANLTDLQSGTCPTWIKPYVVLNINGKKILLISFCINCINIKKYGLQLTSVPETFQILAPTIKKLKPDCLIVLNHDLLPSTLAIYETGKILGIQPDLIIGGHEHSFVDNDDHRKIYYPHAFSRNMLCFSLNIDKPENSLKLEETVEYRQEQIMDSFVTELNEYENLRGLNEPIAKSTLNLERHYSQPGALGTFVADLMKDTAHADIGMISTGFMTHALRYEKDKVLTRYNLERAFSASIPLQAVYLNADELKSVLANALKFHFSANSSNTRFLQCSRNLTVVCTRSANNTALIEQILIDDIPLLNAQGNALDAHKKFRCAVDPFIASGEQGFTAMQKNEKENIYKNNNLVMINNLFVEGVKAAESKYLPGSPYPSFKIIETSHS